MSHPWSSLGVMLVLGILLPGCRAREQQATAASSEQPGERGAADESPVPPDVGPYPPARWRLATQTELEQTVLWVSHILIRHHRVRNAGVSFAPQQWRPSLDLATRTREEARDLAARLAAELKAEPQRFKEYVERFSEDLGTKTTGGSMGGIDAYQLCFYPPVLDALASVELDEATQPIETSYGFHIFKRHLPPPAAQVSGSHIVIGYDDARWLHDFAARRKVPFRTRGEALALAQSLYERARAQPDAFGELVSAYSDHRDAELGGDLGEWSNQEPSSWRREIEVLSSLRVGEIAAPIDTLFGIQILQRTDATSRRWFAADAMYFPYEGAVPESDPSSRSAAYQRAKVVLEQLRESPEQFDDLRYRYSRGPSARWREGPALANLSRALDGVAFGALVPEAIDDSGQLVIAKRLDPSSVPLPEYRLELPAPGAPNVAYAAGRMDAEEVRRELGEVASKARQDPELKAAMEAIERSVEPWSRSLDVALEDDRMAAFEQTQRTLAEGIGDAAYARYRALLERQFEDLLIRRGAAIW
jgi:hypothetical protein